MLLECTAHRTHIIAQNSLPLLPAPQVHQGRVLGEAQASLSLQAAGLTSGDVCVCIPVKPLPLPDTPQTWPVSVITHIRA
jgi:hypothetical protein